MKCQQLEQEKQELEKQRCEFEKEKVGQCKLLNLNLVKVLYKHYIL